MSEQSPVPERPMTRRERRDAERAAERAAALAAAEQCPAESTAPAEQRASDDAVVAVPEEPSAPVVPDAPASVQAAVAERAAAGGGPTGSADPAEPQSAPGGIDSLLGARNALGVGARLAVLVVLAVVTIVAPLSTTVSALPDGGRADLASATSSAAATASSAPSALPSSIAAAVLGSDADVDDAGTDDSLSNVPDAATLARIREAYANASQTCAAQSSGASGDTAAFSGKPEVLMPMVAGTYTISSPYGYRIHPTLGVLKLHAGQDFSAAVGTPIHAAAAGTVVEAGMVDGTGTVTIEHTIDGKTWYTSYLHMFEDGIYVKKGDKVEAGQLIAGVGSTGRSTGPHLHFEVRTKNDAADESTVDPAQWLTDQHAAELSTDCS